MKIVTVSLPNGQKLRIFLKSYDKASKTLKISTYTPYNGIVCNYTYYYDGIDCVLIEKENRAGNEPVLDFLNYNTSIIIALVKK